MNILILGVNGFIGSHLTEKILKTTNWKIYGIDKDDNNISSFLKHKEFTFKKGDINHENQWVTRYLKKCDVILPLAAIANPSLYIREPLSVFELDFELNLEIVRKCVEYKKRIIFPSTSEVYGMSDDIEFKEHSTNFVLGPIHKQRWIYASSKQLLDRLIFAYGEKHNLDYTIFRPFNWIGPKLDQLNSSDLKYPRVVTQFISDILYRQKIKLVDGGLQRRSFTCIDDGINALVKIIENNNDCASKKIFNIGNPQNNISIKELAETIIDLVKTYPEQSVLANKTQILSIDSQDYYGIGYQDLENRVPCIKYANAFLGWKPHVSLKDALRKTLDYYLVENFSEI